MEEIRVGFHNHFKSHLKKSEFVCAKIPGYLFQKRVDGCDNSFLVAPFTVGEVKEVVWACDSNKSPGPDWFLFKFIK